VNAAFALPLAAPTARPRGLALLAAARCLPLHGIGGMQAIAWDVLKGLARRGHRVTVLTTAISGRTGSSFERDGVTVVPLPGTVAGRYSASWWRESRRYVEAHLAGDVDAVLSVSVAAAGLLPLKRSRLAVPFLFQVHGSAWAEALTRWRSGRPLEWVRSARNVYWLAKDTRIYRGFDHLIFVGETLQRQFEQPPLNWMTRGIDRTTIVNGIDTELFRFDAGLRSVVRARFGFRAGDRVLVFAARLHPQKGAAEALRALDALRASGPGYKLLMVGDGADASALRRLAADLGCADAVAFAGAVRREDVPGMLAGGDVFVFPALGREGLPLNVLEALSVGLPCVCADTLRATFGRLPHIAYAAAKDSAAFAAAIRQARLPRGASLLPDEYSLDRCVDAYETVIRRRVGG
jgi:glycosyltransferase involved in cell wall biosynthesis